MNNVHAVQQPILKGPDTSISRENSPNNATEDNLEIPARRTRKSTKQKDFSYI